MMYTTMLPEVNDLEEEFKKIVEKASKDDNFRKIAINERIDVLEYFAIDDPFHASGEFNDTFEVFLHHLKVLQHIGSDEKSRLEVTRAASIYYDNLSSAIEYGDEDEETTAEMVEAQKKLCNFFRELTGKSLL